MRNPDPITTEIIRNRLVAATEEMAKTVIRTAFNPLLYEIQDFSVTLMSAKGDMWAETAGVIVFSAGFPNAVKRGLERWGGDLNPGDLLIVNDPFETGTHFSDTNIYMPIFCDGLLIAVCGVAAHWADIGGKNPGGWCRDTTDMFQEGICFRHQKLFDRGARNEALWDLIGCNVRVPTIVHGDLEAQIAACRQGGLRVEELCAKYGAEVVVEAMDFVLNETDRSMRTMIGRLADGSYQSAIALDSDGVSERTDLIVHLEVIIKGEDITFSLQGTSATAAGPVNLPLPSAKGILASTLKGILLPFDPCNAGHSRSLKFDVPENSLTNPALGAPTDSYGYLVVCLMELMFRCFAPLVPERCPAGGYQLTGAFISRASSTGLAPFVMQDATHGGNGAYATSDGFSNQLVGNGDLPNSPVEVSETRNPVRINYIAFAPEVAGAGRFRGGMGVKKEYELIEDGCEINFVIENTRDVTAVGMFGGQAGKPGKLVIDVDDGRRLEFDSAAGGIGPFPRGTKLKLLTGGGGGWENVSERDPALVLEDVRNEFISPALAQSIYGISVCPDGNDWKLA